MVRLLTYPLEHALSPLFSGILVVPLEHALFSTALIVVLLCTLLGSHRVLRWPLLLIATAHVAVELSTVAALVAFMGLWDLAVRRIWVRRKVEQAKALAQLDSASSWAEHHAAGLQLDQMDKETAAWRSSPEHQQYNAAVVRAALDRLRVARAAGDARGLLDVLRTCVRKSFGGIDNEQLYSRCHAGTKVLIELYVDEVVEALGEVQKELGHDLAFDKDVRDFLYRSQKVFGRTCLALSGGGGLVNYSWGVVRALFDQKMLPTLICGTSAGAVIAATVCTHTDAELETLLTVEELCAKLTSFEESRRVVLQRMLRHGHMYDPAQWGPKIQALCNHAAHPDLTFAEAYRLTGRELCVTVTARRKHEPPLVLSHLSSPEVTIASAVLATVAMPFLIPPQRLLCKGMDGVLHPWATAATASEGDGASEAGDGAATARGEGGGEWRDGSIVHDTPKQLLAEQFGASFTVSSQCNPHVVPFAIALRPTAGQPAISRLQRGRSEWRGGFAISAVLVMLLSDALKWLTVMRELEIMPLLLDTDWSEVCRRHTCAHTTPSKPSLAPLSSTAADPS